MLSLDNAMDADELRSFDERIRRILDREGAIALSLEPKLDGAGVELVYAGGLLEVASTRGDGHVGEDVTANLKQLLSIPLKLDDTRFGSRMRSRSAERWSSRSSTSSASTKRAWHAATSLSSIPETPPRAPYGRFTTSTWPGCGCWSSAPTVSARAFRRV